MQAVAFKPCDECPADNMCRIAGVCGRSLPKPENEMVERVARALAVLHWRQVLTEGQRKAIGPVEGYVNDSWPTHADGARDILATMRKPIDGLGDKIGWSHSGEEAEEAWEQMIDAALGEEGL